MIATDTHADATSAGLSDQGPEELAWLARNLAETNTDGVTVTSQLLHGLAGSTLIDVAARIDAPILVVGSVGHGAIVGALLGSVSQYCVHHATCPVVVVPHADRAVPKRSLVAATSPTCPPTRRLRG
jgi:nucleotide-binding universal stress UspA family protein